MIPIEVIIRFDKQSSMNYVERMKLVRAVERKLHSFGTIGGTISPATFGPVLRKSMRPIQVAVIDRLIRRNLDHYQATGYLHTGAEEELWRISGRVAAFSDVPHDRFLNDVEDQVDAFLEKQSSSRGIVHATYTGVVPLVFQAQRELLNGLFKSFCLAFVMIGVVMAILLRSLRAGLLLMLPNVFPAVVVFGIMGWTTTLIDVGAMMTASVALGIAVDDTLHFLTWFRRALRKGRTRQQAIVEAYDRCALAMTQTTLIAGLGLLVLCLSSFQPVSQFGLLMFFLLVAALVGDLVLLPAMLATRLGKIIGQSSLPDSPAECLVLGKTD
jgi:predicted RND superfamily exporter protein